MPQNALCSLPQLSHLLLSMIVGYHNRVYVGSSVWCERKKNYIRVEMDTMRGKTQKTRGKNQSGGTLENNTDNF